MVSIEFRKQLHRPVVIALLLIVVSSPLLVPVHSARAAGEVYDKEFVWSYGGYRWSFNMSIPKELYEAYREVSVMQRVLSRTSGYGLLTTTKDPFLVQLTDELNRTAAEEGYSHYETVSFVLLSSRACLTRQIQAPKRTMSIQGSPLKRLWTGAETVRIPHFVCHSHVDFRL